MFIRARVFRHAWKCQFARSIYHRSSPADEEFVRGTTTELITRNCLCLFFFLLLRFFEYLCLLKIP